MHRGMLEGRLSLFIFAAGSALAGCSSDEMPELDRSEAALRRAELALAIEERDRDEPRAAPTIQLPSQLTTQPGVSTTLYGRAVSRDSRVTSHEWDFDGDGVYDWSGGSDGRATHVYPERGVYIARLRATDALGRTSTAGVSVLVGVSGATAPSVGTASRAAAVGTAAAADGAVKKLAVMINGGYEERFWDDVRFTYDTLTRRLGYAAGDVYVLNYGGTDPQGQNPDGIIDGPATSASIASTFDALRQRLDADDELLVWITDHGNGYIGPAGVAEFPEPQLYLGYMGVSPDVEPGDADQDYLESDVKQRGLLSMHVDPQFKRTLGLNEWSPLKPTYEHSLAREKYVSHFEGVYFTSSGSVESNQDVFIERVVDYLAGDSNRDGKIDPSAGERWDYDGDGIAPLDPITHAFDEDDWGPADSWEPFNQLNTALPKAVDGSWADGNTFMLFDAGLDDQLDIDYVYDLENLHADGTDFDNDGVFDRLDVNLDGDFSDWVSFDESFSVFDGVMTDDALSSLMASLTFGKAFVLMESCHSGGFVDDLSAPNVTIAAAAPEEYLSWGNEFIRAVVAAAGGQSYWGSPVAADANENGKISVLEAYNFALVNGNPWDHPVYDDNGDAVYHAGSVPRGGDGAQGAQYVLRDTAPSTGGFIALAASDNNKTWPVTGTQAFRLVAGGNGVVQLSKPYKSDVRFSLNGSALQPTPFDWGGPISVPPGSIVNLTLVTPSTMSIGIAWW